MTTDVTAADRPDPVIGGEAEAEKLPEKPVAAKNGPRPAAPRKKRPPVDPDTFLAMAKGAAVRNFNESRDPERSRAIDEKQVYIISFSKVMSHWSAVVGSPVARNLLWVVTFNASKNQVYVDAFRKISNTMVQLEEGE